MTVNEGQLDIPGILPASGDLRRHGDGWGKFSTRHEQDERQSARQSSQTVAAPPQLGLTVVHRRLFGALGAGWLSPPESNVGQVLGVGGFAKETIQAVSRHAIAVRLGLDASKLPDLEVPIFRKGQWTFGHLRDIVPSDEAVCWPGAIPAHAISSVSVSSVEEKHRLIGLTRAASNIDLSDLSVDVADAKDECRHVPDPPCETGDTLVVPPHQDAIFGGLTMAVWAVPRIDPWMDVLKASVAADASRLAKATIAVEAPWWRFPPWRQPHEDARTSAECLWLAAIHVFQDDCEKQQLRPRDLLERTGERAMEFCGEVFTDEIAAWQANTARLLRSEAMLQLQGWRENPVGVAIQLVLTRPDPERFKTWFKDMPNLPPGVAWSAATLCGQLNGYKRLATAFRGCALQRELLSIAALSACSPQWAETRWPSGHLDLRWRKEAAGFVLSHGDQDFARKTRQARGTWYAAEFKNDEIRRAAEKVAKDLSWPCHMAVIENDQVPTSGIGKPIVGDGHLEVEGRVALHLRAPTTFDVESFRRLVAIEQGELPKPPAAQASAPPPRTDVPGLVYRPDFLDEDHERRLIEWIDQQEWSSELQRRVQHYGWRYDYKAREVDSSMHLGPLPVELAELAERLFREKLVPQLPDQVIINEYVENQGITPHVDVQSFADGIATISLLESWEMTFHAPRGKEKVPRLLERRSVAIMHDEARNQWKHEIRKRKSEPPLDEGGKRRKRERRISLTFRNVLSPQSSLQAQSHSAATQGARNHPVTQTP